MAALLIAIPFGQGAVVPQSLNELLDAIEASVGQPQILNGQPAPDLADALRALRQNEFHSFFGSKNTYGMEEKYFCKEFRDHAAEPHVKNKMMVEEKNVPGPSKNGQHHLLLFSHKLDRALQYTAITCHTKYKEVLDQYVTSAKKASRKVKYGQLQDDKMSIDSDDSKHTRKRGKPEDMSTTYTTRFYTFFFGIQVSANDQGEVLWMKRETMHSLFTKLKGTCRYITELQGIQAKWDCDLCETCSEVYLQMVKSTLTRSHVLTKKCNRQTGPPKRQEMKVHLICAWACSPQS